MTTAHPIGFPCALLGLSTGPDGLSDKTRWLFLRQSPLLSPMEKCRVKSFSWVHLVNVGSLLVHEKPVGDRSSAGKHFLGPLPLALAPVSLLSKHRVYFPVWENMLSLWQAQCSPWLKYRKEANSLASSGWGRPLFPDTHLSISLGSGHSHQGIQRNKWTHIDPQLISGRYLYPLRGHLPPKGSVEAQKYWRKSSKGWCRDPASSPPFMDKRLDPERAGGPPRATPLICRVGQRI